MVTPAETAISNVSTPEGADPDLFLRVHDAMPDIIHRSNEIMLGNVAVSRYLPHPDEGSESLTEAIGKERFCIYASDATTRAAEELGLPAAREYLSGLHHYITYFGDPTAPPSKNDIVLCRTWGQFDKDTFDNKEHPNGGKPFLGTRGQLAELLPHTDQTFLPEGVIYRSIIHRSDPSKSPDREHQWLKTTPNDLAMYSFPATGELTQDDTTYHEAGWGR